MQAILFNLRRKEDFKYYYPILQDWWEDKEGFKAIDPQLLSKIGMIIKDKNEDYVCAAWLYQTDSLYGVINWIITNNSKKGKVKVQALKFLLQELQKIAEELGMALIYIPMETSSIKNLLRKENWINTSNNISEFFKQVK